MMNNLKKPFLEFLLNATICTVLINFLQYHDWIKSLKFGAAFGLAMSIFYTFILPKFKKKQ
ncbi:hypothetical protein [Flavobacterium terrigena]|uniref:Uncharacterized protein n=1 Tax=Flavobacterium terrigena TaxID=402734 RepID=A0A1H6SB59_9FLAO|nr:hypothetical protein [Flavobacterium terrigena]SEI65368.1 hypothetical protein SAMN05660918_1295 [Flavobacterium terrigena]